MDKKIIVFLCHFSNKEVRDSLSLKSYSFRLWLSHLRKQSFLPYQDFAIWVSDYIEQFEKHEEYEFHIISPHKGMKKRFESYQKRGIFYHFFKSDATYVQDMINEHFKLEEKNDFHNNRKKIKRIIKTINPNIVILCGAENPYYSLSVLDIKSCPVYVILQTLLNSPKRIEMNVGSEYNRGKEKEIFQHVKYFCTQGEVSQRIIKGINPDAIVLPTRFPSHRPIIEAANEKVYDFIFFARHVTKNKGIEDVLKAMEIVVKSYPKSLLGIIGKVEPSYQNELNGLIEKSHLIKNVIFCGYFDLIEDTYKEVTKASVVVVPGITAALNSTVRESMYLGLPTICYRSPAIDVINNEKVCLLTTESGNVEGLAENMRFSLTTPEKAREIGRNGAEYANAHFSNESIVNELLRHCNYIISEYEKENQG